MKMRKMKRLLFAVLLTAVSCEMLGLRSDAETGELRISFADSQESLTRAGLAIPDTSEFLLTIRNSGGKLIYDGKYGDSPESISLEADSYTIDIVSEKFEKPAFSRPQFGDSQCIVVPPGRSVDVKLVCRQINSGIRLKVDPGFLDACPEGVLLLKSPLGRLVYGYSEKRIAYFKPGDVSLILNEGKNDRILMTRNLKAQDILELKVLVSSAEASAGGGAMSVELDTLRNWISDNYVIGGDQGDGSGIYDAMSISEAMSSVGEEGVWVSGFIVGGDLTSASASFEEPFSSRTNFLLGPRSSTTDRDACLSVNLPSGAIRDALNLVDNPSLLGRKVCLKGNIVESYFGITGIRNIVDYELL